MKRKLIFYIGVYTEERKDEQGTPHLKNEIVFKEEMEYKDGLKILRNIEKCFMIFKDQTRMKLIIEEARRCGMSMLHF